MFPCSSVHAIKKSLNAAGAPPGKNDMRRLILLAIKAGASLALLYISVRSVDLSLVAQRMGQIDPFWLAVILFLLPLEALLLAVRWRDIAQVCNAPMTFIEAVRYTMVGKFFSQTLPSTIGGDAARVWMLARESGSWKAATFSVVIDRGVGLGTLAVIVLVCLPWSLSIVQDATARGILVGIGAGIVGAGLAFLAIPLLHTKFLERFWPVRQLVRMAQLSLQLLAFPRVFSIGVTSVLIQAATISSAWAAARAIAAPLDFLTAMILIPPVVLVSAVPISIAGWGVRESAMIAAFALAGLPESDGLVISVLYGLAAFLSGAVGGLIWVLGRGRQDNPPIRDVIS